MTLREATGDGGDRLRHAIEGLLDREDALVVTFDGDRILSFVHGLGLSPSQSELLTAAVERVVRAAGATQQSRQRERRIQHGGRQYGGRGTDCGGGGAGPVLRLAAAVPAPRRSSRGG